MYEVPCMEHSSTEKADSPQKSVVFRPDLVSESKLVLYPLYHLENQKDVLNMS